MKITSNTIICYIITIISILIFFSIYKINFFDKYIQYAEFVVNCIDIVSSIIIFYNIRKKYKRYHIQKLG